MKPLFLPFFLAGLFSPAETPARKATDKEKLQGTWRIVASEYEGKKTPMEELKKYELLIKGNRITEFNAGKATSETVYQLDPTKKPKGIGLDFGLGPCVSVRLEGIYVLEGDTFKMCVSFQPGKRPTKFTTNPESRTGLVILKRVKQ